MIVAHENDLDAAAIEHPDVKNAKMKVLVSPDHGWSDYVMRIIELEEGGFSPKHTHDWPHINYVVEGTGRLHLDGVDHEVNRGSYAYVPAGSRHQFQNAGSGIFRFICIVPRHGHG